MGLLMYFYYGHIVYEYSYLVDLDILSPLVQLFLVLGNYKRDMGLSGILKQFSPGKLKLKHSANDGDFS